MTAGTCRVCGGVLRASDASGAIRNPAELRITVRLPGKRRIVDFSVCLRCLHQTASGQCDIGMAFALLDEFKALLQ